MNIAKYYLSQNGQPICADCAENDEAESGRPLKSARNETGEVLECIGCREDIPFVGQTHKARRVMSVAEMDLK